MHVEARETHVKEWSTLGRPRKALVSGISRWALDMGSPQVLYFAFASSLSTLHADPSCEDLLSTAQSLSILLLSRLVSSTESTLLQANTPASPKAGRTSRRHSGFASIPGDAAVYRG